MVKSKHRPGAPKRPRGANSFGVALVVTLLAPIVANGAAANGGASNIVQLRIGAIHSSNFRRTFSAAAEAKTWGTAGLFAEVNDRRARFDLALSANVDYQNYSDNIFGNELVGRLDFRGGLKLIPETFTWVVEDTLGQGAINGLNFDTATNRQTVNYFATGPDVTMDLGSRNRLVTQARWAKSDYSVSTDDSKRVLGSIALERQLSRGIAAFVKADEVRVDLDSVGTFNSFTIQGQSLGLRATGRRTNLSAEGGYATLRYAGSRRREFYGNATASRQLSERSTLSMVGGREFTDSGESFRLATLVTAAERYSPNAIVARDPIQADYASIVWSWRKQRSVFLVQSDLKQERRATLSNLDVNRKSLAVSARRGIGAKYSINFFGRIRADDFINAALSVRETSFGTDLLWQIAPRFAFSTAIERGSGESEATGVKFVETRITANIAYTRAR